MQKPPRPKNEGIFSAGLGQKIVVRGIIIGLTSILVFLGAIVYYGHLETARTMAFTALVFSQLFYVFDCRSEDESPFSLGFFTNRYLVGAVAFSAALQCLVLYVPWFRSVFHTVALDVSQWAVIIILTILPTLLSSLRYFLKKKIKKF